MKLIIAAGIFTLIVVPSLFAQLKSSTATPTLSPDICGKGVFSFWLGDQTIGREDFEIKCEPGGDYTASGHTNLKGPGGEIDLNTTLEVDKFGEAKSSTAKGTVGGKPFDQTVLVKGATATITSAGGTKDLPFAKGTSLLGGNIFYMFQFLLAHYDGKRGGVQEIPVFPGLSAKVDV